MSDEPGANRNPVERLAEEFAQRAKLAAVAWEWCMKPSRSRYIAESP
jgi:hypothetical protein